MNPRTLILALANTAENTPSHYIGAANGFALDADGWLNIAYGDSLHSGRDGIKPAKPGEPAVKEVVQRLDKAAALALVNDFKSGWSRFKRAVVGLPIFKGHPDAPRYAKRFPDKVPRGTIADMEATDTHLRLKPVLNEQGAADVDAGWNETSPYWLLRVTGEENGRRVASPFKLLSLGLVPQGNMPGLALTNAAEPHNTDKHMEWLIKLLAALGITLAADASPEDTQKAVDQAIAKAGAGIAAANTLETTTSELTTTKARVTALEGEKLSLANAKETAETNLKAERKARAGLVIERAIVAGKIAAASKDAETLSLANASDFDAAAQAVDARASVIKTKSTLQNVGHASTESQDRQQQILGLVNSAMESPEFKHLPPSERYDAAFNHVHKDPKHAALFSTKP